MKIGDVSVGVIVQDSEGKLWKIRSHQQTFTWCEPYKQGADEGVGCFDNGEEVQESVEEETKR